MAIYLTKIELKDTKFVAEVRYKNDIFPAVSRSPEGVVKKCQELIQMINMVRNR